MTHESDTHTPTPEFRASLEAELVRALHREEQASATSFWNPSRFRAVTRLAAAVILGVVVGAAPAQVQDARQRDSLLAGAEAEERLAALRLKILREEYEAAARRAEVGVTSSADVAAAAAQLRAAEAALQAILLRKEEIRATAAPPRDDIAAPAVKGRDFVKERLQLEAMVVQKQMAAAEDAMKDAERRKAVGAESPLMAQQRALEYETRRTRLALLAEKLELRKKFVESRQTAEETERELQQLELRLGLQMVQRQIAFATERLELVRNGVKVGASSRAELLRAELHVLELKTEMERIQAQLRALRSPSE